MPIAIPSIPPNAPTLDMPSSQDPKPAFMLGTFGLHRRTRRFAALRQKAVDRQRSLSPPRRGPQGGEEKETGLKAGGSELRAGRRNSLELDRTEPVGQMHSERGHQENRRHRYAGPRHQCT